MKQALCKVKYAATNNKPNAIHLPAALGARVLAIHAALLLHMTRMQAYKRMHERISNTFVH